MLGEQRLYSYRPAENRKDIYVDAMSEHTANTRQASSFKINPYRRKKSLKDDTKIDLSRPLAENESLAGLGIQDFAAPSRSAHDVNFGAISAGRIRHDRSTSINSQFSTNSGVKSPNMAYAHPMRHTPRPYTPPITKSYTTSVIGSEISDEPSDILAEEEFRVRPRLYDPSYGSDFISSLPSGLPPLHIHTGGSLTRLNNPSQSSLPSSMPTGRSRGATLQSIDTCTSPASTTRTSMDKAMGFLRSPHSHDSTDASSRAGAIRAARIAYNEREDAKQRKAEKEELRRLRRGTADEAGRRKSEADDRRRPALANDASSEKLGVFVGKSYNDNSVAHARSLPTQVSAPPTPRGFAQTSKPQKRGAKHGWQEFMAWFRTRLLRLGTIMHLRS